MWLLGELGFFCSAPQVFGVLGVFYARFPPREAKLLKASVLDPPEKIEDFVDE